MPNGRTDGTETASSVTTTVLETVADRKGVESTELRPLHEVIDPDALNALFAPRMSGVAREGGRLSFPYCGYEVLVHGDGAVSVRDYGET